MYSGDGNNASESSNTLAIDVNTGVSVLTYQYNGQPTIAAGSPITFTGTVTTPLPTPAATGQIYLYSDLVGVIAPPGPFATTPLNGSSFTLTANTAAQPIPVGRYGFYPEYSGDSNWSGAVSTISNPPQVALTVQGLVTVTPSTGGISTIASGTSFSVSGTVTAASATQTAIVPAGTVTILDNGKSVATGSVNNSNNVFSATLNTTTQPLSAGTNSFTVSFGGSTYWLPATSTPINVQVSPIPTIALSSAQSNVAVFDTGATISIVATVNDVGGAPAPTGTVQFYDGSASIGAPVPILLGAATYSSSSSQFALGTHSITAVYSGNSTYGKVTSAPITFTVVSQITDTLSLISSPSFHSERFCFWNHSNYQFQPGSWCPGACRNSHLFAEW